MLHINRSAFRSFHFRLAKSNRTEFSAWNLPKILSKPYFGNRGPCTTVRMLENISIKPVSACNFSVSVNDEEMNEPPSDAFKNESTEKIFAEIANGDPQTLKKLKVIEFEVAIMRENCRIPTNIKKEHWRELLNLNTISSKRKYLNYLFVIEKKQENVEMNKQKRRESNLLAKEAIQKNQHCAYGFSGNTMFMRIYDQTILKMLSFKLLGALLYSQDILLDCSYNEYMSDINSKFCAKQMLLSISNNRSHRAPINLKLCNVNHDDLTIRFLKKMLALPDLENSFTFNAVSQSYLDLYPKEKLVYLTPHCNNILHKYNHDDVYIIGAFVDRGCGKKVSLAKAKENNLRMAKLPLDYYLDWQRGMKSLAINTMLSILLDMRLYNDWNIAFKNVPRRFTYKIPKRNEIASENTIP